MHKTILSKAARTGLFLAIAQFLVSCSDSGAIASGTDNAQPTPNAGQNTTVPPPNPVTAEQPGTDDVDNTISNTEGSPESTPDEITGSENTDSENTDLATDPSGATDNNTGENNTGQNNTQLINTMGSTPDPATTAPSATGADLSGGADDSPTQTESLSLVGPFIKDTNRSAGPPSVPIGLTHLLSAENWIEFTWAPSTDDQSVEGYEIYRDGTLVNTIRGDSGNEFDYRSWISTSYIDCNYTRYPSCEGNQPVPGQSYDFAVVAVDNQGMKSEASVASVFSTTQRQSSPAELSGYNLVFNEEFRGTSLDRTRWKTSLPWGENETINGERQYFVNTFGNNPPAYDPFVFTGETLQITGIATPPELLSQANGLPYLSGVLSTSDHFEMTYGYVEMRAKVASGEGLLTTFYLFNQDFEKNKPEIDVLEYIGSRPDKSYQTYHYYDSNRARYASGEKHSSPTMEHIGSVDYSAGFHDYAVLWEKDLVVWYIDGEEVRRIAGVRVSDEPMNIITQLVIGSEWIGEPDPSNIPAKVEIDYIKAWQKN